MNSKDLLLVHIDTEVEYKKRAYKTLVDIRSYVEGLPKGHPVFNLISKQQSIDEQAAVAVKFLRLLEKHSLMPGEQTPQEFITWLVEKEELISRE